MEIINKSKFLILLSLKQYSYDLNSEREILCEKDVMPINLYLKIEENLILIKKIKEFCNKIIIKDSLIENEVKVEVLK